VNEKQNSNSVIHYSCFDPLFLLFSRFQNNVVGCFHRRKSYHIFVYIQSIPRGSTKAKPKIVYPSHNFLKRNNDIDEQGRINGVKVQIKNTIPKIATYLI
jgi:hypothetical protein